MGRPRRHDRHLPRRVYRRHGAFYVVLPDGRWQRLAAELPQALAAYAELHMVAATDAVPSLMSEIIARYEREVLPKKAAKTRVDQARQLGLLGKVFGKMRASEITTHEYLISGAGQHRCG